MAVLTGKPEGTVGADVERLWNFFQALPWGAQLPPVSYTQAGLTSTTTLGALISEGATKQLYGTREVTLDDYAPWQVVEGMRHVITLAHQHLSTQAQQVAEAKARIEAAYEASKEASFQRCQIY